MLAPVSPMSILAAVVAMTMLSSTPEAEPARTTQLVLSATSPSRNMSAPALLLDRPGRGASTVRSGAIASAITPFDLRKLSMADFGDVEGLR